MPRTRPIGTISPSATERIGFTLQQRAGERLRAADPAALLQVLQGADREDDTVLAAEAGKQLLDLVVGRAGGQAALDREGQQCHGERRRPRVHDANPVSPHLLGGERCRLEVPDSFADRCNEYTRS